MPCFSGLVVAVTSRGRAAAQLIQGGGPPVTGTDTRRAHTVEKPLAIAAAGLPGHRAGCDVSCASWLIRVVAWSKITRCQRGAWSVTLGIPPFGNHASGSTLSGKFESRWNENKQNLPVQTAEPGEVALVHARRRGYLGGVPSDAIHPGSGDVSGSPRITYRFDT